MLFISPKGTSQRKREIPTPAHVDTQEGAPGDLETQENMSSPVATMRTRASTFLLSFRGMSSHQDEVSNQNQARETPSDVQSELPADKFVIALLGPSGVGKSSFIAHATGQNVKIGHLLTACTDSIDVYEKRLPNGKAVVFVDTPGYDLADKNPNRVLNLLTQWLKSQSLNGPKVNVNAILFFHRITDNRMPIATQSHINRFEKLVGKKDAPKRILLVTTMWDDVDHHIATIREEQLKTEFWKRFLDGGSRVARYKRSGASAWEILNPLVGGTVEDVPLPSIIDSVFHEEPEGEEEMEIDAEQALNTMEQIFHEQQRLLAKLHAIVHTPGAKQVEAIREVLTAEKRVSSKLGSLLSKLKQQNHRWFNFGSSGNSATHS